MVNFIIAVVIVFGGLWLIRKFAKTSPSQVPGLTRKLAGGAIIALSGLLALRGLTTYAVPLFAIGLGMIGQSAEYVSCFGSGTVRKELVKCYNSPFAVETAHIKFANTDVNARIIRSLFDTARQYRESIDVYGNKASVEWPLVEHQPLIMHTAKVAEAKIPKEIKCPDFAKRLPAPIRPCRR